jgi:hypothetical protein
VAKTVFDTSECKVTYIIGAGASAKALPTIKQNSYGIMGFADSLDYFAESLRTRKDLAETHRDFVTNLCKRIKEVAKGTREFGTPDTYAKFLNLKKRESELIELKEVLAIYFLIEQLINKRTDDRVLVFLTTVMEIGEVFPTNIKLLSWNYDIQFQLAAQNFRKEAFKKSGAFVKSPPLIEYYPHLGIHSSNDQSDEFSLIHLNGIAGYYSNGSIALNPFHDKNKYDLNEIISKIAEFEIQLQNLITFAWEYEPTYNKALQIAKRIVLDTDILVVIGYSFPFFNRKVDAEIFESLKSSGTLKKIIYQDPYRTGEFLKTQFSLANEVVIEHVKESDNYLVPPEL